MDSEKSRGNKREFRPERGGVVRLAIHVIVTSTGWCFFGYFWFIVIRRGWQGKGIPVALVAMAVFTVIMVILTSLWIRHNMRIYREDRRRSSPDIGDGTLIWDKTGLELVFDDIDALRRASVVEIEIDGDRKFIRPRPNDKTASGSGEPPSSE